MTDRTRNFRPALNQLLPLLLLVVPLAWAAASAPDFQGVAKVLGRPGTEGKDGTQVAFPRTDLNVVVQGLPIVVDPGLASSFTFHTEGKAAWMTGRVLLTDAEVRPATAQALKNGLTVTALYSPFLDESPSIKCLRLEGRGALTSLAWAAKMVLAATGTPTGPPAIPATPTPLASLKDPWKGLKLLFGPGRDQGRVLSYELVAEGLVSQSAQASFSFQRDGKDLAVWGEVRLPEGETADLMAALLQQHFTVTAMVVESNGTERHGLVDFWGRGGEKELSASLKAVLEEAGF